jgi:PEP-CTERM motif
MNLKHFKMMTLSGCLALAASGQAQALDFTFNVTNTLGNVSGSYSGIVYGLTDNATGPATDVVITSFPGSLNSVAGSAPIDFFGSSWTVRDNSFTVADGQITAGGFNSVYKLGEGYAYLDLGSDDNALELDNNYYNAYIYTSSGIAPDHFNSYATPEPTTLALAGLGGAALLLRKRK